MARDDYQDEIDRNDSRRYDHGRGTWERAGDEMRSWFGDEEAERRRRQDAFEQGGYGRRAAGRRGGRDRFEEYDDYDYGHDMDDYGRGGSYSRDYFDRGYGPFGRGVGLGYGAGLGPVYGRPFGPDYGTDFRDISYGGRGSDVNTRDDIPPYARGRYERGPHAGRGPEGYQRANERIIEDVNERLTRHGRLDASHIKVSAGEGEVTLEGTVDSRRAKRMAEDIAEDVAGVRDVHNRLRIERGVD